MNEAARVNSDDARASRPVFISYATADRKRALAICRTIERQGIKCWIACRDVEPGANYQEEIVRAIRNAPAFVLIFSAAANSSDEIKKELSLASRERLQVFALRIEDAEPSDAFAYELSTRQWIDAFDGREKSLDALVRKIKERASSSPQASVTPAPHLQRSHHFRSARTAWVAGAALTSLLLVGLGSRLLMRPHDAAAHPMQVRLAGFERLSADVPTTLPDAMRDEIMAAFNDDGVIGVSTSPASPSGHIPSYALGGTIRHVGSAIRVIARLTNERTGATLWSHSFSYNVPDLARVPRLIAVDAGNLIRCGLFGASTYPKNLPDPVLAAYLQYCHNQGAIERNPTKALDAAHKVVASVPDFSWGWSAVEIAGFEALMGKPLDAATSAIRADALRAADTAVRLDRSNSEALAYKSFLIDPKDLVEREKLLQRAIHARPLACGCEHHLYGIFLFEVGRLGEGLGQFQRSIDVLALNPDSHVSMALGLVATGQPKEAEVQLQQARDLSSDMNVPPEITVAVPLLQGDYPAAQKLLREQSSSMPTELVAPFSEALQALISHSPRASTRAVDELAALPSQLNTRLTAILLAALGAKSQAVLSVEKAAASNRFAARSWLFYPVMRGAMRDPSFPEVASRLGLMQYWKTAHEKPSLCSSKSAPPFCQMI